MHISIWLYRVLVKKLASKSEMVGRENFPRFDDFTWIVSYEFFNADKVSIQIQFDC